MIKSRKKFLLRNGKHLSYTYHERGQRGHKFAVVAQLPDIVQMARNGKSIKLQKGDFSAEIGTSE